MPPASFRRCTQIECSPSVRLAASHWPTPSSSFPASRGSASSTSGGSSAARTGTVSSRQASPRKSRILRKFLTAALLSVPAPPAAGAALPAGRQTVPASSSTDASALSPASRHSPPPTFTTIAIPTVLYSGRNSAEGTLACSASRFKKASNSPSGFPSASRTAAAAANASSSVISGLP